MKQNKVSAKHWDHSLERRERFYRGAAKTLMAIGYWLLADDYGWFSASEGQG